MAICNIILIMSYNNTMLYKINTFTITQCLQKKYLYRKAVLDGIAGNQLEKKTETIDRSSLPRIFLENTIDKLRLDFV